jgi:prephenate dehydrogenase
MREKVVSVYGYGRFGKLWANILAEDFTVKVYSKRGLKSGEVPAGIEVCDEQGVFDCDALFFCVAISSFAEVLERVRKYCRQDTVFFDTCSVKVYPARWMQECLPKESWIIATHPMFGPDSYKPGRGLVMVMCNISVSDATFNEWSLYFASKMLRIEIMTPEIHDEKAAYSQGITHYMGRLFDDLQLQPTSMDTLGYRSLLEVTTQTCNDSWQLFLDLQKYNPYARKMRDDLKASIKKIDTVLDQSS